LRVKKHCKNYKKRSKLGSVGTSKLNNAWSTSTKWNTFTSRVSISWIIVSDTSSQLMWELEHSKSDQDWRFSCKCFDPNYIFNQIYIKTWIIIA
jgi:hypothetical protein